MAVATLPLFTPQYVFCDLCVLEAVESTVSRISWSLLALDLVLFSYYRQFTVFVQGSGVLTIPNPWLNARCAFLSEITKLKVMCLI